VKRFHELRDGFPNWQVVNAHVATSPKRPQTIHYRGDGEFMISGDLDQPPMEGQTGKPLTMPSPDGLMKMTRR
jgi:hypothetical protein